MTGGYLGGIFPAKEVLDNAVEPLPLTGVTLKKKETEPEKRSGLTNQQIQTMMPQGSCIGCE